MRTENLEYTSTRKKGERIPLLIDCDPGIDDTMALMMARASEGFDLKGITSVSGNLDIETTTKNIELFANVLKLNAVLARGDSKPLVKGKFSAEEVHGSDGLGGASSLFGVSLETTDSAL